MSSVKSENVISSNQDFIRKSSKPLKIVRSCPGCQEECKTKFELYKHLAKCRPDAFLCPVQGCPFASLHKQHYEYHLKGHNGKKEIGCTKCSYKCSTNTMLKSHMRTHEGIMRFRCADCNMVSKQPSQLSQHLASTGHTAAPVLNEDGTVPEDEFQRDFKNHIRRKKRMLDAVDPKVNTKSKKAKMNNSSPVVIDDDDEPAESVKVLNVNDLADQSQDSEDPSESCHDEGTASGVSGTAKKSSSSNERNAFQSIVSIKLKPMDQSDEE